MDAKTIAVSVVSIAIACLFAVALLIPVIAESTAETDTFKNVGYYNMSYKETDSVSLFWDHTKPSVVTVNDVEYTFSNVDQNRITIVCGDDWVVRFQTSINDISYWSPTKSIYGSIQNGVDLSLTASEGSVSVSNTASTPVTDTTTYTTLYCIDKDGDYVMKKANENVYLNGDSTIYALGTTILGSSNALIKLSGTIDDGVVGSVYRVQGATIDNIVLDYTEDSSHDDLYKLSKITAVVTVGGVDYDVVYSYFIVPYEITAERSIHPDESTTALLNIIPLFVVMGIILGAVGLIAYRRL